MTNKTPEEDKWNEYISQFPKFVDLVNQLPEPLDFLIGVNARNFASQEVRRVLMEVIKDLNTFAIRDIELPIAKIQSKLDEIK